MPDRNVDRLTPDIQRLAARLRETKVAKKRLEADEESLVGQLRTLTVEAGLDRGDDPGFSFEGLNMVVPAGGFDNDLVALLRRKHMWHCLSVTVKGAEVTKALDAGQLTEEEVASYRKSRDPWFTLAR